MSDSLFRIDPKSRALTRIPEVEFRDQGFKERFDIQEWVVDSPSVLADGLLIIAKEQACFAGTKERPDLIALESDGTVVVIELKRDDSGSDVHWQAIKYASYWSRLDYGQIVDVYAEYLRRYSDDLAEATLDDCRSRAEADIGDHVDLANPESINSHQRIMLVSHRFSREAVTAVEWLIDKHGVDIQCIELRPYHDADHKATYLQRRILLPVEGIDDLLVKPQSAEMENVAQSKSPGSTDKVTQFYELLREKLYNDPRLSAADKPDKHSRWAGSDYRWRYYHFWYSHQPWKNWQFSYKVWLFNDQPGNKEHRNKARIFLDFHYEYLKTCGIDDSRIGGMKRLLSEVASGTEFSYGEWEHGFEVSYVSDYDKSLPPSLADDLKERLLWLITATRGELAKLVGQHEG